LFVLRDTVVIHRFAPFLLANATIAALPQYIVVEAPPVTGGT
jgi:hypothetical protein